MKALTKSIAAVSLATLSTAAFAQTSLTVGGVSDYYYRGSNLGDAGAYASVDYAAGGFYAGVWGIDDGATSAALDASGNPQTANGNDGLEYDIYLGYGGEAGDFSYGIGYTRYEYTYTSDFEHEINLSGGIADFTLDIAIGVDDDNESGAEDEGDYTVVQLGYSNGPWGLTLGRIDADDGDDDIISESERNWFEVSYSADLAEGLAGTVTLGQAFGIESGGAEVSSEGQNYLVLDINKSFDI